MKIQQVAAASHRKQEILLNVSEFIALISELVFTLSHSLMIGGRKASTRKADYGTLTALMMLV